MNFVSTQFLVFFVIVLILFWGTAFRPAWRRTVLLGANLFFYTFSQVQYVALLAIIAAIAWIAGRGLFTSHRPGIRRGTLWLAVAAILSLLAFFKYYEFFFLHLESFFILLGGQFKIPIKYADIIFPIGISFYSFQAIAYCVEQYRNPDNYPQPYLRLLTYLSFFPTVLSGPILQPQNFFDQYETLTSFKAKISNQNQAVQKQNNIFSDQALCFIISGLFKKVVLATYISETIVNHVFNSPKTYSSWANLCAVYGYAVQIYCDFSGYTDLAIGVALLIGFSLPNNFNAPYLSCNLRDFWRKWHISLSSWLRDYLYIPLGGNKKGNRYVNLFLTMILGGLWHGAHFRFLIWGALHGLGISCHHFFSTWRSSRPKQNHAKTRNSQALPWTRLLNILSWFITFHYITFAWIFFRAEDMERAMEIIHRLAIFGQPGQNAPFFVVIPIVFGILLQKAGPQLFAASVRVLGYLPVPIKAVCIACVLNVLFRMGPDGVLPFIYFQF